MLRLLRLALVVLISCGALTACGGPSVEEQCSKMEQWAAGEVNSDVLDNIDLDVIEENCPEADGEETVYEDAPADDAMSDTECAALQFEALDDSKSDWDRSGAADEYQANCR